MQTKTALHLYDYWMRRRGSREMPLRREIEPGDIAPILPDLFIVEHSRSADPRFRLAGTRLCAHFGRELRGGGFDGLFAPDLRNRIARITENVMAHRAPAVMMVTAYDGNGESTEAEIILLPLASSGRIADRIIGAFSPVASSRPGPIPFRYVTLDKLAVIDTARENAFLRSRPPIAMPTSIMAVRPAGLGETVRKVLHLRIFEGGRQG
jgi:hypothetical protein